MKPHLNALGLRTRMLLIAVLVMISATAFMTVLFLNTNRTLKSKTTESTAYAGKEIAANISEILTGVQVASETLADHERLFELIGRTYDPGESGSKKSDLMAIENSIFSSFSRMQSIHQVRALYHTGTGELFNFSGGNRDDSETVAALLALGIADAEKLSRYVWYPLQRDFLSEPLTGDIRRDSVVLGSRRIYKHETISYPTVQIFALEEGTLYESYENVHRQTGGEVYLLDGEGALLSASREEAVRRALAPPVLVQAVLTRQEDAFTLRMEGESYFVHVTPIESRILRSDSGGWLSVLLVPEDRVLTDVHRLYLFTFTLMLGFLLMCGGLIFYMYRKFMKPISELGDAMRRVDEGDLNAYVPSTGSGRETDRMLRRYNLMLERINAHIAEKIRLERIQRELDMQVLTNQINPHFLYNTLETIVWKAHESGRPDIGKIASSLGRLYRLTVQGDRTWTTLKNEIAHVESYIAIQSARYEGLFRYACRFDEALSDFRVPKLILQPIVENVFLHAIERQEGCVQIDLDIRAIDENTVEAEVRDDGPGLTEAQLERIRVDIAAGPTLAAPEDGQRRGIGLINVAARLRLYMGEPEPLRISSVPGEGTRVLLLLKK